MSKRLDATSGVDGSERRARAEIEGGLAETPRGRSTRATGSDDNSMVGRGHGYGPKTSGAGRGKTVKPAQKKIETSRNYARLAEGLATKGRHMEEATYAPGSMLATGYGSRGRSMETTKKPKGGGRAKRKS